MSLRMCGQFIAKMADNQSLSTRGVKNFRIMANTDTERGSGTGERSSQNKIETSERGSNETKGERSSQTQKGKQKTATSTQKAASSTQIANQSMQSAIESSENKLLAAINSLQGAITKQTSKMEEHDKQIENQNKQIMEVTSKLASYEEYEGEEFNYDHECDEGNRDFSLNENVQTACAESPSNPDSESMKRRAVDDENNNTCSRFKSMAKRFKSAEACDKEIDTMLAENITELFRNGIDEERYNELVKDENNGRPINCEGLVITQTNQMIWEAMSPTARSTDKKMQNIETSIVKSATILSKIVDKMAKMENDLNSDEFGKLIDECNDALALLGHSNKQINLSRKDFLRSELKREYNHLCNHSRPYTKFLFGDDVSKSAREIEDCSKISNRMFQDKPNPFRGGRNRRSGRYPRFRGGYGRGNRGRGFSSSYDDASTSTSSSASKNFPKRGGRNYR